MSCSFPERRAPPPTGSGSPQYKAIPTPISPGAATVPAACSPRERVGARPLSPPTALPARASPPPTLSAPASPSRFPSRGRHRPTPPLPAVGSLASSPPALHERHGVVTLKCYSPLGIKEGWYIVYPQASSPSLATLLSTENSSYFRATKISRIP